MSNITEKQSLLKSSRCFKCGSDKTFVYGGHEDWRHDKECNVICKTCYMKAWRSAHPKYMKEYCDVWRIEHPDCKKVWTLEHPDYNAIYRLEYPDYDRIRYLELRGSN